MNSLNGIDIGDLVLKIPIAPKVETVAEPASDGSLIIYEKELLYETWTLVGGENWGWLPRTNIMEFKRLSSILNANYLLIYDGNNYTVRFKTESECIKGDVVSLHASDVYYNNIEILIMEV